MLFRVVWLYHHHHLFVWALVVFVGFWWCDHYAGPSSSSSPSAALAFSVVPDPTRIPGSSRSSSFLLWKSRRAVRPGVSKEQTVVALHSLSSGGVGDADGKDNDNDDDSAMNSPMDDVAQDDNPIQ